MKKNSILSKLLILATLFIAVSSLSYGQNIGINKDGSTPDPSAMLHIQSNDGGLLIPRIDTSSIISPANGLLIYDTLAQCFFNFKVDHWVKLLDASTMFYLFADRDGDGYGDKYSALFTTELLSGYVNDSTDCNDNDPFIFPFGLDICDGIDNDCNPATPDGSDDGMVGSLCDGPDSDLCKEGTWSCISGNLICSDNTGNNLDICDGIDNDCNPATPDGSDDGMVGSSCDGPDTDFCEEGIWVCISGSLICSDNTGDTAEICGNGIDDDCDGDIDEAECI
jgi:hypothetical protein